MIVSWTTATASSASALVTSSRRSIRHRASASRMSDSSWRAVTGIESPSRCLVRSSR